MEQAQDRVQLRAFVLAALNLQVLLPESLEVDGTGLGSCSVAGFCINGVEHSGSSTRE
jgi:hypothetical protein